MNHQTSYPQQKERVLFQRVKDDVVLLNMETGNYYALNEVGGRVWALCNGKHSVSEIIALVAQEYTAPVETVETDVLALLADLAEEKLLVYAA